MAKRATDANKPKLRAAFLASVEGDAALGATPEQRRAIAQRMQKTALAGNVAGGLAALWAAFVVIWAPFWSAPYLWSILAAAAMPVLAGYLAAMGPQVFRS